MNLLTKFFVLLLIFVLVRILFFQSLSEKALPNIVKAPRLYYQVGIVCILIFLAFAIWTIKIKASWKIVAGFALFVFLGVYLTLYGFVWKIQYDDKGFTYRTIYGRTTTLPYSSITNIKRSKNTIHLYSEKQHFYLDKNANGASDFIKMLATHALKG